MRYDRKVVISWSILFLTCFGGLVMAQSEKNETHLEKATFAGGCFWCLEPPFDQLKGVVSTTPGYTGGTTADPTYEEVSTGRTGHAEAVEILFNPQEISYQELLDVFWRNIDPTTVDRQFSDIGSQYRTAVFYHSEEQKKLVDRSKQTLEASGKYAGPIVTEVAEAEAFYPAEDYHHDYYKKNPLPYKFYKAASGREQYLKKTWTEK